MLMVPCQLSSARDPSPWRQIHPRRRQIGVIGSEALACLYIQVLHVLCGVAMASMNPNQKKVKYKNC